jgi:hypothetical protein
MTASHQSDLACRRQRGIGQGTGSDAGDESRPTPDEISFIAQVLAVPESSHLAPVHHNNFCRSTQGVRECNSSVLFTLGQLGREFPEVGHPPCSLLPTINFYRFAAASHID